MTVVPLVELGNLCRFVSGGTPRRNVARYYEGHIPWITSADITDDKITTPRNYITEEALESSATNIVPAGNVLLVTRTGVGKVAITETNICISQDFTGLIPEKAKVDSRFLFYYLKSRQEHLVAQQRGATIQGITREVITRLKFPLFPLPEQQRIAAVLSKADRLRRLRRTARELSDTYLQSAFLEMFGDPVSNPKEFPTAQFGKVCETRLGKMLDAKQQTGMNRRLYLRNVNVQWGRIDLSDIQEMDFDERERGILRLRKGDVLICEGGEVGRAAIWNDELPECYYQKALHRARPNPKLAIPGFIVWLMWCLANLGGLTDYTSQVTIAHLTGVKLKALELPLPPLTLQQQFAAIVHKFERLRAQQREAERQAEHLFQALLERAFRRTGV